MGINPIRPNAYWVLTKNHWAPFNPKIIYPNSTKPFPINKKIKIKKPQTFQCFRFSFSLTLLCQILFGGDLQCFFGGVEAIGVSFSSCHRHCSLLDSCRLRELRLRRWRVRNNESIATRRAESVQTEIESSRLGRRTSTLGTWMSLPTLSLLTMVLCVAPWLFAPTVMPFGKRFRLILFSNVISFLEKKQGKLFLLIFGFTVNFFFFWGFVIILPNS